MGKNKILKFDEISGFPHVFQYPFAKLQAEGFDMKGVWNENFFGNTNPIVLELGCGKGEYTVGLAQAFPEKNFIGIDIKGARMWSGARESFKAGMTNVAFLRINIELIDSFFAPNEVDEIWLTFPDPQMKKYNKRLTSSPFMKLYSQIMKRNGLVHLKTDSKFLYSYTLEMLKANQLPILHRIEDLYQSNEVDQFLNIRTFYEQQWLARGITIKYICFVCEHRRNYIEPEIEIEWDGYRSFNRGRLNSLSMGGASLSNTNDANESIS
ncbi:MAG: tRNA (guanosine(46)-N7)-methyltransferase TrmB [Tannerellaceae bacterium]|jgi:tRNA (guanine-N7-)-methyltransferase|nr:tRNA (guanosine(46)-N7)-methyltransferase TrmB [Tannerellaceae bacterium]